MDWNFNISPGKIEALKQRIEDLEIDMSQIEEEFIRGSGSGGQKINKTSNCVRMTYPPLGIQVRNQETRERNRNRFLALRALVDAVEAEISPETSKMVQKEQKAVSNKKKAKARARRRHKKLQEQKEAQESGDSGDEEGT